jgi:hypothetical protein
MFASAQVRTWFPTTHALPRLPVMQAASSARTGRSRVFPSTVDIQRPIEIVLGYRGSFRGPQDHTCGVMPSRVGEVILALRVFAGS